MTYEFVMQRQSATIVAAAFMRNLEGPERFVFEADPGAIPAMEEFIAWYRTDFAVASEEVSFSTDNERTAWEVRNVLACTDRMYIERQNGERFWGDPFMVTIHVGGL